MKVTLTLSANAGVALDMDGRRIWVDALHDRKAEGFSTLTPQLQREMMACPAFAHPEFICYTHGHPDHYSEKLTAVARQLWPNARVLSPGESATENGLSLRFVKLPHEGEQYADVAHYGLLVSLDGCNILIPGDCEVASAELERIIGHTPVHLVLLNFPWVTLRKGREFTKRHFGEAHVIVYHLPFAADDRDGYRRLAAQAVEALEKIKDIRLLWDPLQTETVNI